MKKSNLNGKNTKSHAEQKAFPKTHLIPMELVSREEAFDDDRYIFELKFDGIRCLAYASPNGVQLINKRFKNVTATYPELSAIADAVRCPVILDGEIVVFDSSGVPNFNRLQTRALLTDSLKIHLKQSSAPASFVVYDVLWLDGNDVTPLPLTERKQRLLEMVKENEVVVLSRYSSGKGVALYQAVKKQHLEGIVAKLKTSPYVAGNHRSGYWIKIKNLLDEDFAICAYTLSAGKMSILLGEKINGQWVSRGSVVVHNKTEQAKVLKQPVVHRAVFTTSKQVSWVKPNLWATVRFMTRTKTGGLRQPFLKAIRSD